MLQPIKAEELLFTNEIEDDRTNTYVHLLDYDWMQYTLETRFRTEAQGILEVSFEYFGVVTSSMTVKQTKDDKVTVYEFSYPTSLFQKHITAYLTAHIAAWNGTYAFNGEDYVIPFFNEVLNAGNLDYCGPEKGTKNQ